VLFIWISEQLDFLRSWDFTVLLWAKLFLFSISE